MKKTLMQIVTETVNLEYPTSKEVAILHSISLLIASIICGINMIDNLLICILYLSINILAIVISYGWINIENIPKKYFLFGAHYTCVLCNIILLCIYGFLKSAILGCILLSAIGLPVIIYSIRAGCSRVLRTKKRLEVNDLYYLDVIENQLAYDERHYNHMKHYIGGIIIQCISLFIAIFLMINPSYSKEYVLLFSCFSIQFVGLDHIPISFYKAKIAKGNNAMS